MNNFNPQQMVLNMLEQRMGNTPIGQNLINLAKNDKYTEIEDIVRNIAKQKGIDFDKEFNAFKQKLGLK